LPQFVTDFEAGLKVCLAGQWQEALTIFERHQNDPPSLAYAARCRASLKTADEPWDGIWNLTEK
jgi:hypothetical protein